MFARPIQTIQRQEPRLVIFERGLKKTTVQQLLQSAVMKFKDAGVRDASGPTRLEAAYDAILFCALALFAAQGFRVTSQQGHHQVALEGMAGELALSETTYDEIVALSTLRNTKYTGFLTVSDADLALSLKHAQRVLNDTEAWLLKHNPNLFKK